MNYAQSLPGSSQILSVHTHTLIHSRRMINYDKRKFIVQIRQSRDTSYGTPDNQGRRKFHFADFYAIHSATFRI